MNEKFEMQIQKGKKKKRSDFRCVRNADLIQMKSQI